MTTAFGAASALPGPDTGAADLDELLAEVIGAVTTVLADPSVPVGAGSRFQDDLAFDSVKLMQLKYQLAQRFPATEEISLPEILDSLVSVETLVEFLKAQQLMAAL